jgi:predicted nucleic acid-binding protein
LRLLLDTNIFLEVILDQEAASDSRSVLLSGDRHELFVTDYSVHSIGLALFRRKQFDVFREFVNDLSRAPVTVISLAASDLGLVADAAARFQLDFDDAYQYAAANRNQLALISFDRDFDRTDIGRKVPSDVL